MDQTVDLIRDLLHSNQWPGVCCQMPRDILRVHLQLGELARHVLPNLTTVSGQNRRHYGFLNHLAHFGHDFFDLEGNPWRLPVGGLHVLLQWEEVESHSGLLVALQSQTLLAAPACYN